MGCMMNIKKRFVILTLYTFLLVVMVVDGMFISKNSQYRSSLDTCVKTYDIHMIHEVLFHPAMVHLDDPKTLAYYVRNKTGFEVGGPSPATWGRLGIYDAAINVDVTNFASNTLWEKGSYDAL